MLNESALIVLLGRHQFDEVLDALKLWKRTDQRWYYEGLCFLRLSRFGEAEAHFRRLLDSGGRHQSLIRLRMADVLSPLSRPSGCFLIVAVPLKEDMVGRLPWL